MTRRTYWWEDEPDYDPETERERMKRESFQRAMWRLKLAYGEYAEQNKEKVRRHSSG